MFVDLLVRECLAALLVFFPCFLKVYISYGPKGNSDLLLLYGFSLDRNPYNSVDVTVSLDKVGFPLVIGSVFGLRFLKW